MQSQLSVRPSSDIHSIWCGTDSAGSLSKYWTKTLERPVRALRTGPLDAPGLPARLHPDLMALRLEVDVAASRPGHVRFAERLDGPGLTQHHRAGAGVSGEALHLVREGGDGEESEAAGLGPGSKLRMQRYDYCADN
jgi:hypothetical protein